MDELTEKQRFDLLENYYKTHGLSWHHIVSYNNFVDFQLKTILESHIIDIPPPERNPKAYLSYRVYFSNPYVGKASHSEDGQLRDETNNPMYPIEARKKGLAYDAPVTCTVRTVLEHHPETNKPTEVNEKHFVNIARLPVMLLSNRCHLSGLSLEERVAKGECPYDQGGYFLMDGGTERILVSQVKVIYNESNVFPCNKDGIDFKAEMRSMSETTGHSSLTTCQTDNSLGHLKFVLHFSSMADNKHVPVGIVFNALGFLSEQSIKDLLGFYDNKILEYYVNLIIRDTDVYDKNQIGMEKYYAINPLEAKEKDKRISIARKAAIANVKREKSDVIEIFKKKKQESMETKFSKNKKKLQKSHKNDEEALNEAMEKLNLDHEFSEADIKAEVEEFVDGFIDEDDIDREVYKEWYALDQDEKDAYILKGVQSACYSKIGSYVENSPKVEWESTGKNMLENEIFPHLGTSTNKEKAYILASMIRKLIMTHAGLREPDSRDNYKSKRVHTSGILIYDLFRVFFKRFCNNISMNVERRAEIPHAISTIEKNSIKDAIRTAFKTGNWGPPKSYMVTGVSQILSRLSYSAGLSYLRRIQIPETKDSKSDARQIHPSQCMFICGHESPEGATVGMVLNFSLLTTVSVRTSTVLVRNILERMNTIILISDYEGPNIHYNLVLNGTIIAIIPNPQAFSEELEEMRLHAIPSEVSFGWDEVNHEVKVWCDEGRMLRPLIRLDSKTKKPMVNASTGSDWTKLVEEGKIRYMDNNELDSLEIVFNPEDVAKMPNASWCEVHPVVMNGVLASVIPFSNFSQAPRICYSSAHIKQAMSMVAQNFNLRKDTSIHILSYPQKPLVNTIPGKMMGFCEMPHGINICVAIACYTGQH